VSVAADGGALISGYWPHDAPVLAQVFLMLLIAEFFRYWIHRSLHVFGPLWQLHAVHHAADKIYTVNVGRFHPFDKAIQFLGDTVPFLLLGVTPEVFAAYFVLYAINGFYQHSNADVSLGPINWIIAGPELHRWHHSASIREAQSNYGNNLIVWDVLFGTRYLPEGREVGAVGIGNSRWPNGFLRQMSAPFTTPTDRPDK
jgi:sterol desaturase/sphingolipid hydroxylase (fatty acid hydroxylase superfamily)